MIFEFQTQPPPQIEQSQQGEQSGPEIEHVVDQHIQPNRQRFQPNEQPQPFQNGPKPLLVRFFSTIEKKNIRLKINCTMIFKSRLNLLHKLKILSKMIKMVLKMDKLLTNMRKQIDKYFSKIKNLHHSQKGLIP